MTQLLLFDLGPRKTRLTRWEILCRREPRLRQLEADVKALARRGVTFTSAWATITRRLRRFVGWEAENPICGSQGDYDTAYRHLLNAWTSGPLPQLPDA